MPSLHFGALSLPSVTLLALPLASSFGCSSENDAPPSEQSNSTASGGFVGGNLAENTGGDVASPSGGTGGTSTSTGGLSGSGGDGTGGAMAATGGRTFIDPLGQPPLQITDGLFNQSDSDDLGLSMAPGTQTITIFSPTDETDHYSNGVVMAAFGGELFAQWQSSPTDEDSPDTRVVYSRSSDGISWSEPVAIAPPKNDGYRTSGGFWATESELVAYLNVWPDGASPRGGVTEFSTTTDGANWSAPVQMTMLGGAPFEGIFEQDPRALPDGRIVSAAHFQPGLKVSPCYTDDPSGTSGWVRADFDSLDDSGDQTRELEPSWYLRADGVVVMVFRDQAGSYRKLASMSEDWGETWSTPVETNMPDSRSKQSAGNLPDESSFLVGNPVPEGRRIPLVVTLSDDGQTFDRAFLLRGESDLQSQRYSGQYKTLGYSYPKSMVHDGYLYVSYSTNKEDVEYTRVPLSSL